MNLKLFLLAFVIFLPTAAWSKEKPSHLAAFISTAEMIIVAKCTEVGPVNIIGKSRINVDVVHVLKGKPMTQYSYSGRGSLEPGKYYLIRFPRVLNEDGSPGTDRKVETVIEIVSESEAKGLDQFSLEIAILRSTNMRVNRLENEISRINYELELLKTLQRSN
jgi:hypothetical protein